MLRELKKVIVKDSNVVCVAEAVACLGRLAKGLRKDFASSARAFFPVLLDKYKDKNSNLCTNCDEALSFCIRYCPAPVLLARTAWLRATWARENACPVGQVLHCSG